MAFSVPFDAARKASIVVVPSFARALAFVTSATRAPASRAKASSRSTSTPVFTSTDFTMRVPTSATSGFTSPLPSGCTRFERKTKNRSFSGSIQIAVPVYPP